MAGLVTLRGSAAAWMASRFSEASRRVPRQGDGATASWILEGLFIHAAYQRVLTGSYSKRFRTGRHARKLSVRVMRGPASARAPCAFLAIFRDV